MQTGDVQALLDSDRNAMQRPRRRRSVGRLGLTEGLLGPQLDNRVQRRIDGVDPVQDRFGQLARGNLAGRDGSSRSARRAHDSPPTHAPPRYKRSPAKAIRKADALRLVSEPQRVLG
jgi:hypothetical protein